MGEIQKIKDENKLLRSKKGSEDVKFIFSFLKENKIKNRISKIWKLNNYDWMWKYVKNY